MEGDATVQGFLTKVQDALGAYDPLVLTDGQGNEILDSEGTRGLKKCLYLCSLDQGFLNLCKLGAPFEGLNIVLLTLVPPKSTGSFQS